MAWIRLIDDEDAASELRMLYDKYAGPSGEVDHILKIHSLNPDSMVAHYELYKTVMRGSSDLSRTRREMIAVVVSAINHCVYWVKHHGAGLRKLTKDEELVEQLIGDFRTANVDEADKAMLAYAAKLTREPWNMAETDVINLREQGFTDRAILDINQVAGYYAYVNRLADGLGVELEDYWEK